MKAAILEELNSPLLVEEIEIPDLECGQVLVKVYASGICGAQLGEISGAKGPDKYLPHLLGHEGAGIVENTGIGVSHVKKGDHVVMHWRKGIGIDAKPARYKRDDDYVGAGPVHTFCEYAVVSENRLTPINKNIPFNIATLMGCSVTTGLGIVNNDAQLKIGQSIAVIGCGSVGLNVIQAATMVSANLIIAIDIYKEKINKALEAGATYIINGEMTNIIEVVEDLSEKNFMDIVVDCTGIPKMIDIGYNLTSPGGKMILVGQPHHDQKLIINRIRNHYCGKTLMDSQGGQTNPTVDIPRYLNLYRSGKLKLDNLITHRFSLEQINDALNMAKSGKSIKVIIEMDNYLCQ
jgi:Zn-dependent alcohol dehydrogenase